jgi:hypothetical protein
LYFNTPDAFPKEQVEKCWYAFLLDEQKSQEFLGQVYDICDQRMFTIESTPRWPAHPGIVMEFLSILKAQQAFQDGKIFETNPSYGLDLCEKIDRAFERIKKLLDRCSSECSYTRQRRLDEEFPDRYAEVESLSRFILPEVFEQSQITSNQLHQNKSDTIQKGDAQ